MIDKSPNSKTREDVIKNTTNDANKTPTIKGIVLIIPIFDDEDEDIMLFGPGVNMFTNIYINK